MKYLFLCENCAKGYSSYDPKEFFKGKTVDLRKYMCDECSKYVAKYISMCPVSDD